MPGIDKAWEWFEIGKINVKDAFFQVRGLVKDTAVKQLAESFKIIGQTTPVYLYVYNDGRAPIIICGFHRVSAGALLGWEKLKAVLVMESEMSAADAMVMAATENVLHGGMPKAAIINTCKKLVEQGKPNIEIAKIIGKSEASVRNYLKAVDSGQAQNVAEGKMSLQEAQINKRQYFKPVKGGGFKLSIVYNPKCDKPVEVLRFIKEKQVEIEKLLAGTNLANASDSSASGSTQSPINQ